ncbi:MAG: hypothetical protein MZU97_15720 [Bacillus subtilis]|nr:hypothetical protein [Bacillus subtilis]
MQKQFEYCTKYPKRGKAALNFLPHGRKLFKETVRLGYPGEPSKEKMAKTNLHLEPGLACLDDTLHRPLVVSESFQVFECTWMSELEHAYECQAGQLDGYEPPFNDFNGITSKFGAHFILKIDKIIMKEKYHQAIIDGVKPKSFPKDSCGLWVSRQYQLLVYSVNQLSERTDSGSERNGYQYGKIRSGQNRSQHLFYR